ncbi:MAG: hypothetical protein AB7G93_23475 [Bdellovibrionales bacterium]
MIRFFGGSFLLIASSLFIGTSAGAEISTHACAPAATQYLTEYYAAQNRITDTGRIQVSYLVLHPSTHIAPNMYFEGFLEVDGHFVKQEFGIIVSPSCERVDVVEISCGHGC